MSPTSHQQSLIRTFALLLVSLFWLAPVSAEPIAVEDIQQMIISLKKKNIGVLITDHNVRETLSITDRSYLLYSGEILKSGDAETLANDEEVRRIYLGKKFRLD